MTRATPTRNPSSDPAADLARLASEALANAHSPYSNVRVGDELLARDGRVLNG